MAAVTVEDSAIQRWRVHLEAAGHDVDVANECLPAFYNGSDWVTHATQGDYGYRYAARGDGTMTLRTSRMQGTIRGDIPPADDYIVQWIVAGSARVDVEGDDVPLQRGRPMLFPTAKTFVFEFDDYDQKLVHLNRRRVAEVAVERGLALPGDLRFDHLRQPGRRAVRIWFETVGFVSRVVQAGPVSDLLWSELARLTAVSFLELYPPRAADLPSELLHPRAERIRFAAEYLHEHAEEPITQTELARIAGISPRALQEGFGRTLGMPPLLYLRQVRLDRARDDLRSAAPGEASVADVARRWGFTHLGRFAMYYRQQHGENPSETLRS